MPIVLEDQRGQLWDVDGSGHDGHIAGGRGRASAVRYHSPCSFQMASLERAMRAQREFPLTPKMALAWAMLGFGLCSGAQGASSWEQGTNYFLIDPPQATAAAPGKIEVTEVFSYACPACNHFYPVVDRLKASLPANAELDFIAAGFRPDEDWPMFQRAYYAAQILGLDKRTHAAMFDAIWKTGELAVEDPRTQRFKEHGSEVLERIEAEKRTRVGLLASLVPAMQTRYESLRASRHGIAVGVLEGSMCRACRVTL